jgi:hypothetical protein
LCACPKGATACLTKRSSNLLSHAVVRSDPDGRRPVPTQLSLEERLTAIQLRMVWGCHCRLGQAPPTEASRRLTGLPRILGLLPVTRMGSLLSRL